MDASDSQYTYRATRAGGTAVIFGVFKDRLYGAWEAIDGKWIPCMWYLDGKFYDGDTTVAIDLI